ncbi:MAG TPA: DUF6597 domain-containing transcriptional factor [Chitinispirillaceae bacterium]|nr:DUF6597 domain-containing transcriptional factor [Chitinispirillaceae bacterium]
MNIKVIKPGKESSKHIKFYWVIEGGFRPYPELVYPTGEIQLILHYKDPFINHDSSNKVYRQPQSAVCGQKTSYSNVFTDKQTGAIGVLFFPHTASLFFPFPIIEITDMVIDLSDIYRDWNQFENEYQNNCTNNQDRIHLIESFFIKKIRKTNSVHHSIVEACINDIDSRKGMIFIRELANRYDLSVRSLQRIFNDKVGLSAKQYSVFKKLEYGIKLCKIEKKLIDSCYEAGYYDQSNFIKTVKKYTGLTPSELKKHCD